MTIANKLNITDSTELVCKEKQILQRKEQLVNLPLYEMKQIDSI